MPRDSRQLEILSDLLATAQRNVDAETKHSTTGILIAVAFALVKPDSLESLQRQYGMLPLVLLYLSLLLLLACILTCLTAMWLRSVPVGGISIQAHELSARLLLAYPVIDDDLMAAYLENQLQVWKDINQERHAANMKKTNLIHRAQQVLAAGILAALVSSTVIGVQAGRSAVPSGQRKQMPDQKQDSNTAYPSLPSPKPQSSPTPAPDNDLVALNRSGSVEAIVGAKQSIIDRLRDPQFIAEQNSLLNRLR